MTLWIANAMEKVMFDNDLFHCAFCEMAQDLSEHAACEGPEEICLDCHEYRCPTVYACVLEGNFG